VFGQMSSGQMSLGKCRLGKYHGTVIFSFVDVIFSVENSKMTCWCLEIECCCVSKHGPMSRLIQNLHDEVKSLRSDRKKGILSFPLSDVLG
jgi:hypothetical protein